MITPIPAEVKNNIVKEVKEKFNKDIGSEVIDFVQDFQSRMAAEKGFTNCETVRFYNLAVFKFNKKKGDSKNTMLRLLGKHDGDVDAAKKEFKELGKELNIRNREAKEEELRNRVPKIKKRAKVSSMDGMFTAR